MSRSNNYFLRFKLTTLVLITCIFSSTAFAHYKDKDDLSESWTHNGQIVSIKKHGFNKYIFCNEDRNCATGFFTGNRTIQVPQWSVSGVLNDRKRTINWSNGTQWVRYSSDYQNVHGRWFHQGKPTQIIINGNSRSFLLINEMGQSSTGYRQNSMLVIPSLNVTGYLIKGGRQINWSNNTVWVR